MNFRPLRVALPLLLCAVVSALVAATIYWTMFDPRWVTFLGGVLFAAVASLASNASKAQWALARRTAQLKRLRARADEADARSKGASNAFQAAEARLRHLGDVLRSVVLFIDRDQVCRFHNRAAEEKLGHPGAIDGRPLRELVGEAVYRPLERQLEKSLAGEAASYDLVWTTPGSEQACYAVRQLPANGEICLLVTPVHGPQGVSAAHGETLYLREIAKELTGWDDPKGKLAAALREDRFVLVQQKIAPLELGRSDPLCYEVLLRLQEEEENLLPPGGFLPEAERLGMMEELDRWVVRNVISAGLERLREPGWQQPLYCVNLSADAVRSADFARYVQSQLAARRFPPSGLCFEIAEPDLAALPAEARRLLAALKPLGCRFTVDGFGSAKGSFAPLNGAAVDFLKIDGVIVQNMLRDSAVRARAAAINGVCHKIGMRTIAEFVEERETLAALRRMGVDYAQGFGIARPEPMRRAGASAPLAA